MKFLIIGDLHGKIPNIHFKDFDAIIAPGDFCSDNVKKYQFQSLRKVLKDSNYKKKWWALVGKEKAIKLVEESVAKGKEVLKHINSFNVPVYIVPGNWDWTSENEAEAKNFIERDYYTEITEVFPNIINTHNKIININGYSIIGYGFSSEPEYPQYKEDLERKRDSLRKIKENYEKKLKVLDSLFKKSKKPIIFLSHNVPFNTKLDTIKDPDSPRLGQHFGSLISRELIKKYQPIISIGAHMHESYGKDKIGKTIIINSGFGPDVNTLIELSNNKIKNIKFND